MLRTTSSLIKSSNLINVAAPLNLNHLSGLKINSSLKCNGFNLSTRSLSLTPVRREEMKKQDGINNEKPINTEIPKKEQEPEKPKEQEPPKTEKKYGCKDDCNETFCPCKIAMLLALAGIAGTAYYYYYEKDNQTFGEDTTVVYVLGGPGAGKGTQCANLVKDFGFVHLSAGDLLREERKREGSKYGELINNYIKEGKIVPSKITIALLENAMAKSKSKRFLIDGFPRKMDQAKKFERTVCKGKFVLYFECPESVMLERLLNRGKTSGRVDDNIESIKKRFVTFTETSYPVIKYFEKQNKIKKVSCVNSPQKVYAETKAIFTELFSNEKN